MVADCGDASLVEALLVAGVDAYGVDPSDLALEPALDRGVDVRAEPALDHLEVVADEALGGIVLTGSVQWLRPNERERVLDLVSSRLAVDGTFVLHSASPAAWAASAPPVVRRGFVVTATVTGGDDRRLAHVGGDTADSATVNAAIDAINDQLLGPTEYLVVATRER